MFPRAKLINSYIYVIDHALPTDNYNGNLPLDYMSKCPWPSESPKI